MSAPLEIRYCASCGYLTRALSLAATIERELGEAPALKPVSGGRYELWRGDALILKRTLLRVPSEQAMMEALRAHDAADATP